VATRAGLKRRSIMGSMGGRLGLANWQWLFLLEGIPSVMLGLITFAVLADKPSQASWLTEAQRREVLADLEADNREVGPRRAIEERELSRVRSSIATARSGIRGY
jgi:hypothetical protein